MRYLVYFLLIFLVFSDQSLWAIRKFVVPEHFKVAFEQQRYLKHTDITLKSQGEMELIKKKRLLFWRQQTPFENEIVVDLGESSVKTANLDNEQKIKRIFGEMIFDIVNGGFANLEKQFNIKELDLKTLSLIPKTDGLKQFLREIVIKGDTKVESFYMQEKSGNYMKIHFLDFKEIKDEK